MSCALVTVGVVSTLMRTVGCVLLSLYVAVSAFSGTVLVAVRATDPSGLNTVAWVTIVVIPLGSPRFVSFNASEYPASVPTSGGTLISMVGENLLVGSNISARYQNDAMRAVNVTYFAQVGGAGGVVCWAEALGQCW